MKEETESNILHRELVKYLKSRKRSNSEEDAQQLLDLEGGFVERFNYFVPKINEKAKQRILISGCAVGSELIVAKRYGFQEIYGIEILHKFVSIAKKRLEKDSAFNVIYYDGNKLPYKSNFFSMIYSGHVVEHASSPANYIHEHLRVLGENGYLFIEFPNRYNFKELHTGLVSFEWLPTILRNFILKILAKKYPLYKQVLSGLKQISISRIKRYCNQPPYSCQVIDVSTPARGYVRMLLKKVK